MADLRVDEIVGVYMRAAAEAGRTLRTGDTNAGKIADSAIANAYRELRRRGLEAQRALLPLLEHPDPTVRSWAGAHALEFAPEQAEPVLRELVADDSLPGFAAEMTLREWKLGTLRFT